MKKILNKVVQVLQVVLAAPVKLPAKAVGILKYIALGLGVLETVLENEKEPPDEPAVVPSKGIDKENEVDAIDPLDETIALDKFGVNTKDKEVIVSGIAAENRAERSGGNEAE